MTIRIMVVLALLFGAACAPYPQQLELHEPCPQELSAGAVVADHWLGAADIWRLRHSALLELRGRKLALEGFMILDLVQQRLHMVAMNDMGLVFFELIVTPEGQELRRALPQLQQQSGLAEGIASSLRRIYLEPQPQKTDSAQMDKTRLHLWRPVTAGDLSFVFDCNGRLRETRQSSSAQEWQVVYENYQLIAERGVPEKIVMKDLQQAVTLTLWQREIRLEP